MSATAGQRTHRSDSGAVGIGAYAHMDVAEAASQYACDAQIASSMQIARLMVLAFFSSRTPRSAEYRAGCRAALEYRILGCTMRPEHPIGSCQADAWSAGAEEGHAIWRRARELTKPRSLV